MAKPVVVAIVGLVVAGGALFAWTRFRTPRVTIRNAGAKALVVALDDGKTPAEGLKKVLQAELSPGGEWATDYEPGWELLVAVDPTGLRRGSTHMILERGTTELRVSIDDKDALRVEGLPAITFVQAK